MMYVAVCSSSSELLPNRYSLEDCHGWTDIGEVWSTIQLWARALTIGLGSFFWFGDGRWGRPGQRGSPAFQRSLPPRDDLPLPFFFFGDWMARIRDKKLGSIAALPTKYRGTTHDPNRGNPQNATRISWILPFFIGRPHLQVQEGWSRSRNLK